MGAGDVGPDEPGALDHRNSILLFELLRNLIDRTGISVTQPRIEAFG
jgi:hypothetical protein